MKKIRTKTDLQIPGYGFIPAGSAFFVVRFNKRFVYCKISEGTTLQLARKRDCEIVY